VQPLLLDLSAADAAAASKSSSSSSGDDEDAPTAAQEPVALPAVEAWLASVAALQDHGVLASVTQSAKGAWRRVLLQLQAGVEGADGLCQAQTAAVSRWLAAGCPQCVASLRCWYSADSQQQQPGCGAGSAQALLSALPPGLAGQLVPVVRAGTSQGAAGSKACCCIELLLTA
jgi:hypothetical protein